MAFRVREGSNWKERGGRERNAYAWNFALSSKMRYVLITELLTLRFFPPLPAKLQRREERKEAGAAAGRESKVKLHRREVRGSAELLRVLPIARRVIAKDAGGTTPIAPSPFRLGFLLLDRSDSRVLSTK